MGIDEVSLLQAPFKAKGSVFDASENDYENNDEEDTGGESPAGLLLQNVQHMGEDNDHPLPANSSLRNG
jgi:hypothetical protein